MASLKSVLVLLSLSTAALLPALANASASQSREAFISASHFDGSVFSYEYIAYDASEPVRDAIETGCKYTTNSKVGVVLKSVEIKVIVSAQYKNPGAQIKRTGSVDVRRVIAKCESGLSNTAKATATPVEIRLPRISVSSKSDSPSGDQGTWEPYPPIDQ